MRISKVLLLLASATLALAQQAVVSKGILIGEDKTDKNAKGPEIYENPQNHQTAASSIITGDEVVLRLTSDLNQVEEAIKEAYPDIGPVSIAKALRELIPSSTKDPQAKFWVLSVAAIDIDPLGFVDAKLFALSIQLNVDGDGKVTLPSEQTSYLNVANIQVNTDRVVAEASTLFVDFGVTTTQEFEEYFTSSKENALTQWLYLDTGHQFVLGF
ncbi:hypothetical protein DFQ26_006477 [Actinomortierella ambigua]|nr:hypothetical protein DFQ26_006477 [Actinomortierella ambigua]